MSNYWTVKKRSAIYHSNTQECTNLWCGVRKFSQISHIPDLIQKIWAKRYLQCLQYIISQKWRAAHPKPIPQAKQSSHAKIQLFLSTFKNGQKSKGHFCQQPLIIQVIFMSFCQMMSICKIPGLNLISSWTLYFKHICDISLKLLFCNFLQRLSFLSFFMLFVLDERHLLSTLNDSRWISCVCFTTKLVQRAST